MPIVSIFFGITVSMYWYDHPPPHVHVEYQRHEGSHGFPTGFCCADFCLPACSVSCESGSTGTPTSCATTTNGSGMAIPLDRSPASTSIPKVAAVRHLGAHRLHLAFADGSEGEVDLGDVVRRDGPLFAELRDPAAFARVFLVRGAPTWPNGFDIAPWALYDTLEADGRLRRPQAVK